MALGDIEIMPTDDNEEYTKHVWFILIIWTLIVLGLAIALAAFTL